ncbi:glucose-6-phosphate isomerase [Enterobacteriaceae endosymbiont of Macroplea appendiculata]|uniref:glucose-6-phosphate isomerase n=1 Tax=Enterobacteriaceae endosymbiont of Macroplea appendiculata TaxID=2675790 RepID=UPI001449B3EA|nr:glucose-6-phosphate isomerase [Enterobacteriaceae endosymbiont of Macroplea appendiculata]QJC30909.1 glucose-6-phosphate isomerase [Enterobacteriaceae endosymbiont of Macroplea appendiculata]
MKNINPTKTISWKALQNHIYDMKHITLTQLFQQDQKRFLNFSINFENKILFDFSKNIINYKTMHYLTNLAKEINYLDAIHDMFYGEKINKTEQRSVLHIALRNYNNNDFLSQNNNIYNNINIILKKIKNISNNIINGIWKGYTNQPIKNIINVGIGGSHLGPLMTIEALKHYQNHLNIYFISSLDSMQLINILKKIKPENSIFIISSKTFTTQETITNALCIKEWFIDNKSNININEIMQKHFIGITANTDNAINFGIPYDNVLPIWEWVGGRFSLWSSIGLIISLSIGFKHFKHLLDGAAKMDHHFFYSDITQNMPIIMALISIWYNNFWNTETEACIPYCYNMRFLIKYLQQLNMESNGKSIDRVGNYITYQTSPIIWGDIGTDGQHSFFQLLHQGTKIIPCDFIAPVIPTIYVKNIHNKLIANYIAQTKTLAFGNMQEKGSNQNIYQQCIGNHPSNSIFIKKITPYNLGLLIALYEHKIFMQGVILNIFSFDQWGVELGKKFATLILDDLHNDTHNINKYDVSTNGLINFYKSFL